jgi:hypothetical protein
MKLRMFPSVSAENIQSFTSWIRPGDDIQTCANCQFGERLGDHDRVIIWDFCEPDLNEIECSKGVRDRDFINLQQIIGSRAFLQTFQTPSYDRP